MRVREIKVEQLFEFFFHQELLRKPKNQKQKFRKQPHHRNNQRNKTQSGRQESTAKEKILKRNKT